MSKKFTEYSQLNLSEINKEVLKKWDESPLSLAAISATASTYAFMDAGVYAVKPADAGDYDWPGYGNCTVPCFHAAACG